MNDDLHEVIALYRSQVREEPDASLDAAVLKSAQCRQLPNPAVMAVLACAAAVVVVVSVPHPVANAPVAANPARLGRDVWTEPYVARDAGTDPYVAIDAGPNHYVAIDAGANHYFSIDPEAQPIVRNAHVVPLPGDSL